MRIPERLLDKLEAGAKQIGTQSTNEYIVNKLAESEGIECPSPQWGGLRQRLDQVYIFAAGGRAQVAKTANDEIVFASNWQQLEEAAVVEVTAQGGDVSMGGIYACSSALAKQAEWV